MTRLVFDMEQVAGLAAHSRAARARRMTLDQRARIYGEENVDVPQPGEEYRTPPCLWLVKDEGIYLMSPGFDPDAPEDARERPPIAYAVGFDPKREDRLAVWDRARDAVGGDDFCDEIPLEWVDAAVRARAPAFAVDFAADSLALVLPPGDGS